MSKQEPEILFETEVIARCRMSRRQVWKLEQAGRFPRRRKYGLHRVGWLAREIDQWIEIGAEGWMQRQTVPAAA